MLSITLAGDSLRIGERFSVSFQRTLRIPDDGKQYPLPPGLGTFPIERVEDYAERVPAAWRERGGYFIPMYQREAMWLNFDGAYWKPNAVKIGIGHINSVSGDKWDRTLRTHPQDYLVCPDQPWLDGINAGDGFIRQFVAMPLGQGYTVEGQLTGKEEFGGLQIVVFEPKPGKFPDKLAEGDRVMRGIVTAMARPPSPAAAPGAEMGLGAGGRMRQKIYPDSHGLDTWDQDNYGEAYVHIINSEQYALITGKPAPASPVDAVTYTQYGYPWFDLYDEQMQHLSPSEVLQGVQSVKEMDAQKGVEGEQDDSTIVVPGEQVIKLKGQKSIDSR